MNGTDCKMIVLHIYVHNYMDILSYDFNFIPQQVMPVNHIIQSKAVKGK